MCESMEKRKKKEEKNLKIIAKPTFQSPNVGFL